MDSYLLNFSKLTCKCGNTKLMPTIWSGVFDKDAQCGECDRKWYRTTVFDEEDTVEDKDENGD